MVRRWVLIEAIDGDFNGRLRGYHKSRREGLSTLAGVMLDVRSANVMELAAALPREIGAADDRYQYIERQLMNPAIEPDAVTKAYAGQTNIGTLHEKGHKEPLIIAMDAKPSRYTALDYGMRWGIETMFSDFKSRGFGLMQPQIQKPSRQQRLTQRTFKQALRSLISVFTAGLRFLRRCSAANLIIPKLWEVWINERLVHDEIEGW
jgi:hypothetical protein